MRKIKLANAQKRDAEVIYGSIPRKNLVHFELPDKGDYKNVKVLKSPLNKQYDALLKQFENDEALSQAIVDSDPEIDEITGKFITNSQKVLVNNENKPVYKVTISENIYNPDGTLKGTKPFQSKSQNVMGEFPISWTGKQMPIAEAYNKFIFAKKYQLTHSNGLTFDFLYNMAKELFEKKVLMLLAAGPKGNEPLVFYENGKPYRAFLEGRIDGDAYLLLMHISNLELKPIL